jgi:hypothetical protein
LIVLAPEIEGSKEVSIILISKNRVS